MYTLFADIGRNIMSVITQIEKGLFLSFFNRDGYVLNFSTNDFDNFTLESIGVALCQKYKLSKGKSLTAFSSDANELDVLKLFIDLFAHYELSSMPENDELYHTEYYNKYKKLKPIVNRIKPSVSRTVAQTLLTPIKSVFNSDYINDQIDAMIMSENTNPTEAIGKAKELIESCCITILDNLKLGRDKNWDLIKLVTVTTDSLNLTPKKIDDSIPLSKTIKQILQSLRSIAGGIAELRNPYGSGHGKTANFKGLEERHAKLAIGSCATLVNFLWDSYELQQSKSV